VDAGAWASAVKDDGAIAGADTNAKADRIRKREILRVVDRLGRAGSMNCQSYAARYGEAIGPGEGRKVGRRG